MDSITVEHLTNLTPGDVVQTGGVFPGLCNDKCYWEYLGVLSEVHQFKVIYCGVSLGNMFATAHGNTVTWGKK